MVFKITVARQPFAVEFETGSVSEAIGVLEAEGTEFAKLFDINFGNGGTVEAPETGTAEQGTTAAEPAKRGRKAKGADPATASAPPPAPIPVATLMPPVAPTPAALVIPADGSIPPFLDRTGAAVSQVPTPSSAGVAAAPPPPLLPSAPPVAPVAAPPPVTGPVGLKVIAEVERRGVDDASKAALVKWLADAALVVPGATFSEAIDCLRFITDDKLGGVHAGLFPA